MSCSVGDRKRIEWAANSLRSMAPTAAVDVLQPAEGECHAWSLEATLADTAFVRSNVMMALVEEDLDLQLAQPRGEHFVVIATA